MGQIKHKMGNVGGGVDISHKSKMSNAAKNQMSFPGGMPGPGDYGKMDQPAKIVGKGMAKYLAGESVGMRKMDPMYNGKAGIQSDDFLQFDKSGGPSKSGGPAGMFGTYVPKNNKKEEEEKDEKTSVPTPVKSDMEKIQDSKKKKIKAGKDKKAEGQSDLKKARETKFVSRGSGEDSGVSTRKERRDAIRAARKKKREGRKAERKARKGTVIKQKSVRIKKSDD